MLAGTGLRNTEPCKTSVRDVDFAHAHINVEDSKTEAGIRKVDLSPMMLDELLAYHVSRKDPGADGPFFPTRTGAPRNKDNVNQRVIRPAVKRANERRAPRGLPPLPKNVSAHMLRRTYISMMLAAGADIPYVMAQVGHEDSKVTLEIYAKVLKRRDRDEVGRKFDALLGGTGGLPSPPYATLRETSENQPQEPAQEAPTDDLETGLRIPGDPAEAGDFWQNKWQKPPQGP